MKITHINSFFATATVLAFSLFSNAQSKPEDLSVVIQTKRFMASGIERGLDSRNFGAWVQDLAGKNNPVTWQVNDCGRQIGIPEGYFGNNSAICTKTSAKITDKLTLHIYIEFATCRQGRIGSPRVRYIFVGDEAQADGAEYEDLRAMRNELINIKRSLASFEPNDGDFHIAMDGPEAFEGVSEILVNTRDYNSKGIPIPVKKNGILYTKTDGYKMLNIIFDGKRLSFDTATVKGVSFRFDGAVENLSVDSHGAYTRDTALRGRGTKLVKGKKVSEGEILLNYESFPGC